MAPGSIKALVVIIVILFVVYIIMRKKHEKKSHGKNYRSGLRARNNSGQ
ncbi:MAG: hypothetical protein MUC78_00040 [Bacteroidales bacterium]|jgi:hypothetical protein|nr:hypothetical protein [Bacteroidales bacterium]